MSSKDAIRAFPAASVTTLVLYAMQMVAEAIAQGQRSGSAHRVVKRGHCLRGNLA